MARARATRETDREQEMRALLALRETEGLTMRELAAASEVPAGTLSWWAAEIGRRDRAAAADPDFVGVLVARAEEHAQDDASLCFEIALASGARVVVPARYGLARLVRELSACCIRSTKPRRRRSA